MRLGAALHLDHELELATAFGRMTMRGLLRFGRLRGAALLDELGERVGELAESLAADRGDLEDAVAALLEGRTDEVGELARIRKVDLVEGDQLRALEQRQLTLGHRVGGELAQDDVEVGQRVAAGLEGAAVEHVQQRGAALDVAEELEAEALALARALDEAGHVGDRVAGLPRLDDAEVRVQGRERVVGDLRLARRVSAAMRLDLPALG